MAIDPTVKVLVIGEVLAMIKRAKPLPAIPSEFPESRLEFVVPIQFKLR